MTPRDFRDELGAVDGNTFAVEPTLRQSAAFRPGNRVRSVAGRIALVGGAEWQEGCDFDAELLAEAGGDVLVLPTAAAYEHPERAVATAERWFTSIGGRARGLMVLGRADAEQEANAAAVRSSPFVYLGGGSPLHLRSVLKDSIVWDALLDAWHDGATVAGPVRATYSSGISSSRTPISKLPAPPAKCPPPAAESG